MFEGETWPLSSEQVCGFGKLRIQYKWHSLNYTRHLPCFDLIGLSEALGH